MLQFEQQGNESLDRIRKVLRRADGVRKVVQSPGEMPGAPTKIDADKLVLDAAMSGSENNPDKAISQPPMRKRARSVVTRQRGPLIIRFPTS